MGLFFALLCLALAIAGATAFVIFWPLSLVHLRDRHPQIRASLGDAAFANPRALWWLLSMRYRDVRDAGFTGLATPAMISLSCIVFGLVMASLLWLWSVAFPEIGA